VLVLLDDTTGQAYIGAPEGLEEQPEGSVATSQDGLITGAPEGYTLVPPDQLLALDQQLAQYQVPVEDGKAAIRPEGLESAVTLQPTLRYDPVTDTFTSIATGTVYSDNG
jgi:hypothetical protein